MAQMGQSKSVIGEFMKQKRKVSCLEYAPGAVGVEGARSRSRTGMGMVAMMAREGRGSLVPAAARRSDE